MGSEVAFYPPLPSNVPRTPTAPTLLSGYLALWSIVYEITEKEPPALFAFIRQFCAETRAPFPRRVYLSPEVNACVFYHGSILSLILPTRKNLLIGLGLVNVVQ